MIERAFLIPVIAFLALFVSPLTSSQINPIRMTEDVVKAKEIAKAHKMPIALVFVGSDWCSFSKKLLEEVLCKKEFVEGLKTKLVFVKVDFPELHQQTDVKLLEQQFQLKNQFRVSEFPTIVLVDETFSEITRFGYEAQSAASYAACLQDHMSRYEKIKHEFDHSNGATFATLRKLYLLARDLGCKTLEDQIIDRGLTVDVDAYFHLEKYETANGKEKKALRDRILSFSKTGSSNILLKLALFDYQERVDAQVADPIQPLIEYAKEFGVKEKEQSFRVHLLIANHLSKEGLTKQALHHAQQALKDAPKNHHQEILQSIKFLKAEMIANKDL